MTKDEFVEKARKVHGDKYDYSNSDYKKSNVKIDITCPKHGVFSQVPSSHLMGCGCPKCNKGVVFSLDEFISEARKIHGDKYDYSKVEYTNVKSKVEIVCRRHGTFIQTPEVHLRGCGCPKCKSSKLEDIVMKKLNELNLNYVYQSKVLDLGNQTVDFYLENIGVIIECQGEQHYRPVHFSNLDGAKKRTDRNAYTYENGQMTGTGGAQNNRYYLPDEAVTVNGVGIQKVKQYVDEAGVRYYNDGTNDVRVDDPTHTAYTPVGTPTEIGMGVVEPMVTQYMKKTLYDLFYNDFLYDNSKGKITICVGEAVPVEIKADGSYGPLDITNVPVYANDGSVRSLLLQLSGFHSYNAGHLTGPDGNEMDTEAFLASLKVMAKTAIGDPTSDFSAFAANESIQFRVVTQKYGEQLVNWRQQEVADANGNMYIELDLTKPCKKQGLTIDGYVGIDPEELTDANDQFTIAWCSYDSLELETEMGEVSFQLTSVDVAVEERKLRATSFETLADYQAAYAQGLINDNELSFIDENIQPDWNQTIGTAPDYIKNKPSIPGTTGTPKIGTTPGASITIQPYKIYEFGTVSQSVSIEFGTAVSGYTADYSIRLTAGSNCAITLPNGCRYSGGSAPTYTFGRTYEINVSDGLVVVGEFY